MNFGNEGNEIKINLVQKVKAKLNKSGDFSTKDIYLDGNKHIQVTFIYLNGLVDTLKASDFILRPLMNNRHIESASSPKKVIDLIEQGVLYNASQVKRINADEVINDLIDGSAAIIFNDPEVAFTFDVKGFERRSITEPTGENVKKGSKDSFVETMRINTATLRRKIRTPELIMEESKIGKQTQTPVTIVYIDGITNMDIVNKLKERLDRIDIDDVLTIGIINEYIKDSPYSMFPQIDTTERPDKFCSDIVEGRVGLIVDGLPYGIIVPAELGKFLQAPEDYSQETVVSSILRIMRYTLFILTLVLPGLYVAVTTFHPEMIPTDLALSISISKQGVPFPVFLEVILMLIAFEILVEAGLRLPKSIGQAVSIVGAIIVGEAAVSAKLLSPAVIIVIAMAAIASFTIPNQDFSNAVRVWRFIFVILCGMIGLFGLTMGLIVLLFVLAKMESFGVPYLAPFAGVKTKNMADFIIRLPDFLNKNRPMFLKLKNEKKVE